MTKNELEARAEGLLLQIAGHPPTCKHCIGHVSLVLSFLREDAYKEGKKSLNRAA